MSAPLLDPDVRRLREVLLQWTAHGGSDDTPDQIEVLEGLLGSEVCRKLGIYRVPADFLLSVVIPVYNEVRTLERVLQRVQSVGIPCEIICVDDGSTDGTRDLLPKLAAEAEQRG